ncbi:hypothetical protein FSP39_000929 [Pinctada imbricata]|uniref:AB hydrolase-1 domain-containing protein n=1 Tax=Pinctada imbricata TaxID=66713 RepID=A0AA89C4P3_PINIB|nr:hypothetical protein FSP39_000929 [Pinctada imbricata]
MSVSLTTYIISILVAVLAVVYIMYPVPALTPEIEEWRNSGKYLKFKSFYIFYKVVKGRSDQGGTLLTIHGFPTSSHDWVKILDLGLLKNVQQVIFFDMLGYGLSQKPRNYDFSIMEQADIAEAILNHLDIKEFHVLAHDYGDTVALEMLARLINYIAERSKYKERWVGALVGAKSPDPVNPRQFIDHYKKTVPNPSITVLPDHIGHYPQWEAPQEFITAYNTFLQKQLK